MKKRNVKSIMSLALMGLLLTVFAPTDIFAQRDNRRDNNKKEKVVTPVGARIDALPDGYEVFELDGLVYYRLDETYYKAVLEPNGNVVYEVVRV